MKLIWNQINSLKAGCSLKNTLFIGLMIIISIFIGAMLWLLIGKKLLPGGDWLICFIGYPAAFIGFFGGILYLYNHEFE